MHFCKIYKIFACKATTPSCDEIKQKNRACYFYKLWISNNYALNV